MPRIKLTRIYVSDQERAREFYTKLLDFQIGIDEPSTAGRWLTVVSDDDPDGPALLLEPNTNPPARTLQRTMFAQSIPVAAFEVDDVDYEYERLVEEGVNFLHPPVDQGRQRIAILNDSLGNWIQLVQQLELD